MPPSGLSPQPRWSLLQATVVVVVLVGGSVVVVVVGGSVVVVGGSLVVVVVGGSVVVVVVGGSVVEVVEVVVGASPPEVVVVVVGTGRGTVLSVVVVAGSVVGGAVSGGAVDGGEGAVVVVAGGRPSVGTVAGGALVRFKGGMSVGPGAGGAGPGPVPAGEATPAAAVVEVAPEALGLPPVGGGAGRKMISGLEALPVDDGPLPGTMTKGPACTVSVHRPDPSSVRRWNHHRPAGSTGLVVPVAEAGRLTVAGGSVAGRVVHSTEYPLRPPGVRPGG